MVVLLAAAVTTGLAQKPGQTLYESNCAGCHGLDGRGGEHAPNITVERVRQMSDEDLRRIVRDGIRSAGMPGFGSRLTLDQLAAVTAYVRSLQGGLKTSALPGNADSGRDVFFHKGRCSECHMIAGHGGFLARDLSSYAGVHSVQEVRDAILNPGSSTDPQHTFATVVTNRGQRYTGVVRNEDNFSLQLQARDGAFYLFNKSWVSSIERDKRPLMPADYASKLTPADVNDLIGYLMQVAATQPKQSVDTD